MTFRPDHPLYCALGAVTDADKYPRSGCLATGISLLQQLIDTACEHDREMDLMQLVNYLDLYRVYLGLGAAFSVPTHNSAHSNPSKNVQGESLSTAANNEAGQPQAMELLSFEKFVSNRGLLAITAAFASEHYGELVSVPMALENSIPKKLP